ncbi:MAG: hypothetical protein ACE5H3_10690 [Planctomycetota bacterium]
MKKVAWTGLFLLFAVLFQSAGLKGQPGRQNVVAGRLEGEWVICMAGNATLGDKESPFILIEHSGNPHLVFFREREGDPMGDAESANVMLAPTRDRVNDLLLFGGDFNNEPFRAFQRKERVQAR